MALTLAVARASNVVTFLSILSRLQASKPGPSTGDMVCDSNSAFMVILAYDQHRLVQTYFDEKGLSGANLEVNVNNRPLWYIFVHGIYRHQAISVLMSTKSSWKDFRWLVTVVPSDLPMERYRQFPRSQNMRHFSEFYAQFTFAVIL